MRPFISFATLIALCWHALIGCCVHHAHASEFERTCQSHIDHIHEGHVEAGDVIHFQESSLSCGMGSSDHSRYSCRNAACTLFSDGKSAVASSLDASKTLLSVIDCPVEVATIASAIARWREHIHRCSTAPGLPLYLINQAILT
jgi:hypothetical protein